MLFGDEGNDQLTGGQGMDQIAGGAGDDLPVTNRIVTFALTQSVPRQYCPLLLDSVDTEILPFRGWRDHEKRFAFACTRMLSRVVRNSGGAGDDANYWNSLERSAA